MSSTSLSRLTLSVAAALSLAFVARANAQPCQHGVSIFKTCESPKRSCATNADCDDQQPCTSDVCDTTQSNVLNCTISLAQADTCGDTTKVTDAFDQVASAGGNVRVPAVGNLPISGVFGNAVCCAGPSLPCFVGPAGSTFAIPAGVTGCGPLSLPGAGTPGLVTFQQNQYVVQPNDPNPLPNQGNVKVQDLCNQGLGGCNTSPNTVQFGASTNLVTGCVNTPVPDSTPCPDTDGNACTTAGCNAVGTCDQNHLTTVCNPDNNPCTDDLACNPQTGACEHPPVPDSTPCPDTDNNACTTAGCEAGTCVQSHTSVTCTPDTNPCTSDPACNPTNGLCEHPPVPDSTPCPDTDANACTTAGCEAGQCVQTHQSVTCTPDTNPCTLDPACNPTNGLCEHPPVPDSTPCPDTDNNACTAAGCEVGQCVQTHITDLCDVPDHYSCYEALITAFPSIPNVSVVDRFGSSTGTVKFPHRLCAPADKNDEDPTAPSDPDHLTGYFYRNPAFQRVSGVHVNNQFNDFKLDVLKPDFLLVPTLKNLTPPPPPAPTNPAVDHFLCYKVKLSRGQAKFQRIENVKVDDQFGTAIRDLIKPYRFCAPANKNNEDPTAPQHTEHLLCYKTRVRAPFPTKTVYIGNQFQQGPLTLRRRWEFCIPTTVVP